MMVSIHDYVMIHKLEDRVRIRAEEKNETAWEFPQEVVFYYKVRIANLKCNVWLESYVKRCKNTSILVTLQIDLICYVATM